MSSCTKVTWKHELTLLALEIIFFCGRSGDSKLNLYFSNMAVTKCHVSSITKFGRLCRWSFSYYSFKCIPDWSWKFISSFSLFKTTCLFKFRSLHFCGLQCGPVYKRWISVIKIRKLEWSNLWFPFVHCMINTLFSSLLCLLRRTSCENIYSVGTNCSHVSIQSLASSIFYSLFCLHILFDWMRSEELIFQIINGFINHPLVFPDALKFK